MCLENEFKSVFYSGVNTRSKKMNRYHCAIFAGFLLAALYVTPGSSFQCYTKYKNATSNEVTNCTAEANKTSVCSNTFVVSNKSSILVSAQRKCLLEDSAACNGSFEKPTCKASTNPGEFICNECCKKEMCNSRVNYTMKEEGKKEISSSVQLAPMALLTAVTIMASFLR